MISSAIAIPKLYGTPMSVKSAPIRFRHKSPGVYAVLPTLTRISFPLLPVSTKRILVPTETRLIHAWEIDKMTIMEEACKKKNCFINYPVESPENPEKSFDRFCCLATIEKVQLTQLGALFSIRGIVRVDALALKQSESGNYSESAMLPVFDDSDGTNLESVTLELKNKLFELHALELKLKSNWRYHNSEVPAETLVGDSLKWLERLPLADDDLDVITPDMPELISFAAFNWITGVGRDEAELMVREKSRAMEEMNTESRLHLALEVVDRQIKMVKSKLALELELRKRIK